MNIKRELSVVLISLILLSVTAIAAPTNETAIVVPTNETAPIANFTVSPHTGYAPMNVTFTDISRGKPTSWKWYFGDGTNSTVENPVHKYKKAGNFTVGLTVKNAKGISNKVIKRYIKVLPPIRPPVAVFTVTQNAKNPLLVRFKDKSKESPTSWSWNFGDKSPIVKTRNTIHIYQKPGKYTVTLTVMKGRQMSKATKVLNLTLPNKKPVKNTVAKVTKGKPINKPIKVVTSPKPMKVVTSPRK